MIAAALWMRANRPALDLSSATAAIAWNTVQLNDPHVAGAWELTSSDRRVGGFSGLAFDRGRLIAVTDGGMIVTFAPPSASSTATIIPLPAVSGNPRTKIGRDAEALVRDPLGRGWWVAFEQRHQLIRYDNDFRAAFERIDIAEPFSDNRGIEALSREGTAIRWYAESSGIADATSLPDGRTVLVRRGIGPGGFSATLVGLGAPLRVNLGRLDNVEGLAAQPLPGGGTRLWLTTDNDLRRWRRTLLVVIDLPPRAGE